MEDNKSLDANPQTDAESITETISIYKRLYLGLKQNKLALLGSIVLVLLIFSAVFAPYVAPHDPDDRFQPMQEPNSHSTETTVDGGTVDNWHVLGTDSFGKDIFSRIVYGSRISLLVAFATIMFAFTIGTTIGLLAGFYGGWIDNLLMRYIDFQWAFPEIILAIGIIAIAGGTGVWNVVIAIGIAFIDDFARLIRGEILSIREQEYIMAAEAIGMSDRRILVREVMPNAASPMIVQASFLLPVAILAEAALSFLGLGVSPETPTWGLLVSQGRDFITSGWWISIMPGLAIMVTVLSFNFIGDMLRDVFDVTEDETEIQQR